VLQQVHELTTMVTDTIMSVDWVTAYLITLLIGHGV